MVLRSSEVPSCTTGRLPAAHRSAGQLLSLEGDALCGHQIDLSLKPGAKAKGYPRVLVANPGDGCVLLASRPRWSEERILEGSPPTTLRTPKGTYTALQCPEEGSRRRWSRASSCPFLWPSSKQRRPPECDDFRGEMPPKPDHLLCTQS